MRFILDGQPNKFWMMFGSPFKINFRFESKIFKRMINGFAKIVHFDVAAIEYNKMRRWTYLNFAKIGVVEVKTMLLFHDLYWTDYQTSFLDDVWQSVQDRLWLRTQVSSTSIIFGWLKNMPSNAYILTALLWHPNKRIIVIIVYFKNLFSWEDSCNFSYLRFGLSFFANAKPFCVKWA